jgi:putative ABC transport system permease protein
MMLLRLAKFSLLNRKGSVLLTVLAIAVSVFVLLGVEHIRHQAKTSFGNTVSGVDLIVGGRTGDINLLLYSVFRLGNATNGVSWTSYNALASHPDVAWTIPISLGDSHRGFRVMGTTNDYFSYYRYGQKQPLHFAQGGVLSDVFDVVLGAEVARKLGYGLGDELVLSHGMADTSFSHHDANPFRVVGILSATGTPADQALYVGLAGIEAIHSEWPQGAGTSTRTKAAAYATDQRLTPTSITAFLVGLKSKMATFKLQRHINNYTAEPLSAILPGVALAQLWQMMAVMENTLRLVSAMVLLASLLGLSAMLLASLNERRREIAIMRVVGASPYVVFLLIQMEALLVTVCGAVSGLLMLFLANTLMRRFLAEEYGLSVSGKLLNEHTALILLAVVGGALIVALIPAIAAYRNALHTELGGRT